MFVIVFHPPRPFQIDYQFGNSLSQGLGLDEKQKKPERSMTLPVLSKTNSKLTGFHVCYGGRKGERRGDGL